MKSTQASRDVGLWPGRLAATLMVLGAVLRAAPLLDPGGRLLRQFPTEDGYLMLTIARNLALGHGMTVSAGEVATNGTQPLMTFIWAMLFAVVDGDRTSGVAAVLVCEALIATVTAWLIYRLARRVLPPHPSSSRWSLVVAAAWYASPVVLPHTMNCLETGAYALAVVAVAMMLTTSFESQGPNWRLSRVIGFGLLLGTAFWIRNDAVFLVFAACVAHFFGTCSSRAGLRRAGAETIVFGAVSLCMALPWLVYNQLNFGNIVPISGRSESLGAMVGEHVHLVPVVLFEYFLLVVPVPQTLESSPIVVLFAAVAVVSVAWAGVRVWRQGTLAFKKTLVFGAVFACSLSLYYGVFFGASWFLNRYLMPISTISAVLWAAFLGSTVGRLMGRSDGLCAVAGVLVVGVSGSAAIRAWSAGNQHAHFQVVMWVSANVGADVWVGAPQSGTLGFFHDRTINLDGKVDPHALEARQGAGIAAYVLSRELTYIVDWASMSGWIENSELAPVFELAVHDVDRNLAVLRRRQVVGDSARFAGLP